MSLIAVLGWLPVAGVVAGLARAKFRRLPLLAATIAVAAYVALVGSYGGWAATCWDCQAGLSETRGQAAQVIAMFVGVYLVLTLAGIWLGARFSNAAARLIGTLREASNELRAPHRD